MIDGHCHLDKRHGTCSKALAHLYEQAGLSGVQGIILLNLPSKEYDNGEVLKESRRYDGFFKVFPSLVPAAPSVIEELGHLKTMGAQGLKLHPMLDGYSIRDARCADLVRAAGSLGLPVLIDAFPWGKNLLLGNVPEAFAWLAEECPQTRIAIAHAGGHRILDALMVAKYYKNIFLDLSLSLLYYRGSSLGQDMVYAVQCLRGERIFWGTDYPDRDYQQSVALTKEEIGRWSLSPEYQSQLWRDNVIRFIGNAAHEK